MTNFTFVNNASTTLASAASAGATTITLASATNFPGSIPAGTVLPVTLNDAATHAIFEVVYATSVSGSTLTVTRAQEGTSAQNWGIGDLVFVAVTAGKEQAIAYGNGQTYAADAGTTNAYAVTLTPPLTAHVVGLPIRWKAANANTGPSTFNDGAGAVSLVDPNGNALSSGEIVAGRIYSSVYDGANAQLSSLFGTAVNPVIGDARNLKATLTSAGTSVAFTADEVVVGAALGGVCTKIANFSKTLNISTTGAGGMDTGSAPASSFIAIYAAFNPTTGANTIFATNIATSSGTIYSGGNIPSGFTETALIAVWPTDSSPNLIGGFVNSRHFQYNSTVAALSGGSATTPTSVSLTGSVPSVVVAIDLLLSAEETSVVNNNSFMIIGPTAATVGYSGVTSPVVSVKVSAYCHMYLQSQAIFYESGQGSLGAFIAVCGYSI